MRDSKLEDAIKEVIGNEAGNLRNAFREVIGDPSAERARICGGMMTNIVTELKGLAQQFPVLGDFGSATIENKGAEFTYNHLRYWKKVNGPSTNALPTRLLPDVATHEIDQGGVAFDAYIVNADEPFGPFTGNGYPLYTSNGQIKIKFVYALRFNTQDELHASVDAIKAARTAVLDVYDRQCKAARKAMDNVIDIAAFK
jgi:hypothetical protein